MNAYIYLAGPIAGCDKGEANDWRTQVSEAFIEGIVGISPLRCEPLIKERYDDAEAFAEGVGQYQDKRFGTPAAIANKNELDMRRCDLTLAYLPSYISERRPSYGTVCEIAWAKMLNKPCILVTDDAAVANHPVITAGCGWVLDNFDDAVDTIHGLYGDYVSPPLVTGRAPGFYTTVPMAEVATEPELPLGELVTRGDREPPKSAWFSRDEI